MNLWSSILASIRHFDKGPQLLASTEALHFPIFIYKAISLIVHATETTLDLWVIDKVVLYQLLLLTLELSYESEITLLKVGPSFEEIILCWKLASFPLFLTTHFM